MYLMEPNEYTIGFIAGLVAKPLYVGEGGDNGILEGEMVAYFTGSTLDIIEGVPVFDKG